MLAAVGPHPRGYARLTRVAPQPGAQRGLTTSELAELLDRSPEGPQIRAWLGRAGQLSRWLDDCKLDVNGLITGVEAAVGEPLRIAAELDGKIDTRTVRCVLGDDNMAALAQRGLAIRDRPGGIAIEYRADRTGADLARADSTELAARCTGAPCMAVVLGPSNRRLWVQSSLDEKAFHLQLSGPSLGRVAAAIAAAIERLRATEPALQPLSAHARPGVLALEITGDDPLGSVPLALALRTNLLEAFKVSSSSMLPTLLVNDHVFVVKGPLFGAPVPGDLLVYHDHDADGHQFVKRYLAGPGQTIVETEAGISIDGRPLATEVVDASYRYHDYDEFEDHDVEHTGTLVREHLGGRSYLTLRTGPSRATGTWTVTPGHVFLVGDNRNHSNDSRYLGASPEDAIVGRVVGIWLAYHDGEPDWDRMGMPVE